MLEFSVNTIRNMESRGREPITSGAVTLRRVQTALEAAGVEFTNGGRPGVRLKENFMREEDKIFADQGDPAVLHVEGQSPVPCYTLQEAVVARNNLPPEQRKTATINVGGRVYGPQEIDRLHHRPRTAAGRA